MHPGPAKDIVVQSWRGQKSLAEAARRGHIGNPFGGYYLDLMYSAASHYAADPMEKESAGLTDQEKARILGGEACMWSEYATPENVDMRIWPRTAAIAERLWSPQEVKDVASMYRRLAAVSRELDLLGTPHKAEHRRMLERLAGQHPVAPLALLSDVLEPVKEYSREQAREYTQFTPLNRLVDATLPESDVARDFSHLVDRALAGGAEGQASRQEVRRWLERWQANDAALEPLLESSFLLREAIPLSQDLSALASAGIEALDDLAGGRKPPPAWVTGKHALLESAAKARAELLLMIVPPVQKLVDAAASQ